MPMDERRTSSFVRWRLTGPPSGLRTGGEAATLIRTILSRLVLGQPREQPRENQRRLCMQRSTTTPYSVLVQVE
jgi:hypothetical protein